MRPERISVLSNARDAADGDVVASGTIADVQYLGADSRVHVELERGVRLAVTVASATWSDDDVGTAVDVAWPRSAAFAVIDDDGEPAGDSADLATSTPTNTFVNNEGEKQQ